MKKIIFVLILFLSVSCSKSQDNLQLSWSVVTYYYNSGPLPPPYFYQYRIIINEQKNCFFSYSLGYDEQESSIVKEFSVTDENLNNLNQLLNESGLLEGKIESLPENNHPVGGSLQNIQVVMAQSDPNLDQPPRVIIAPYFPLDEYKEKLNIIYEFIKKLVPKEIIDEFDLKREEYINKKKSN